MTRPGVEIILRDQPVPRSAPTDTGVWFVAGAAGDNDIEPTLIRSMSRYVDVFGVRDDGSVLYDAVDTFFREGGARCYVVSADVDTPAPDLPALLDKFDSALGPGQVSIPGATTTADHNAILQHCADHNRVALLDAPVSDTEAEITAAATALHADTNASYGSLWAPVALVPGVTPGVARDVSYSAVEAGIIARNDVSLNANVPAAGVNGQAVYALDLTAKFTDAEYETMNTAGACLAKMVNLGVRSYGYRTVVDPVAQPLWTSFGNARLRMAIVAGADNVAERYVFSLLDGRRRTINDFGAELSAMLVPYFESGALYGATAQEAFRVDVGEQVNTEETIAAGELHAVIMVRMSPFAELVVIEIVKVATTEAIAA